MFHQLAFDGRRPGCSGIVYVAEDAWKMRVLRAKIAAMSRRRFTHVLNHLINQIVFERFLGAHEFVPVGVGLDFLE